MLIDHILIIGFGAPARKDDVRPYVERFFPPGIVSEERVEEVLRQYDAIGGASPYNGEVIQFHHDYERELNRMARIQVFLGMRQWMPLIRDPIEMVRGYNLRRGLAIILAPHRSEASFDRYVQGVDDAVRQLGSPDIRYQYLDPWFDHPYFIEAHADALSAILLKTGPDERPATRVIFCAHAIPTGMAARCQYEKEVLRTSELVAAKADAPRWQVAYQSASIGGTWIGPSVLETIQSFANEKVKRVVLVPVGFVCRNKEILYDLDIEARQAAGQSGMRYERTGTVIDHPKFLQMFLDLTMALLKPA